MVWFLKCPSANVIYMNILDVIEAFSECVSDNHWNLLSTSFDWMVQISAATLLKYPWARHFTSPSCSADYWPHIFFTKQINHMFFQGFAPKRAGWFQVLFSNAEQKFTLFLGNRRQWYSCLWRILHMEREKYVFACMHYIKSIKVSQKLEKLETCIFWKPQCPSGHVQHRLH